MKLKNKSTIFTGLIEVGNTGVPEVITGSSGPVLQTLPRVP